MLTRIALFVPDTFRYNDQAHRLSFPEGPCSLGATALQPAGRVLPPLYRVGPRDVPRDPLARVYWLSGPASSSYSRPGPGSRLRNVSAAGVSQPRSHV